MLACRQSLGIVAIICGLMGHSSSYVRANPLVRLPSCSSSDVRESDSIPDRDQARDDPEQSIQPVRGQFELERRTEEIKADLEVLDELDGRPLLVADDELASRVEEATVQQCTLVDASDEKSFPDFRITGFFQLDSAFFAQSEASRATLGDIQDGTGFRRTRLAAVGHLTEETSYHMEFDLAQAQARFVDMWGQFDETPCGHLRIGRFRQPFGMTEMTSAREIDLMERPTLFAMSPFRQTGVMLFDGWGEETGTWAVSGFRTQTDNFGNIYGDDGGFGTAGRLTSLWIDDGDERLIHFGVGASLLDPARDQLQIATQDEIFVGQQPNLGPTGLSVLPLVSVPPFVNSGLFRVERAHFWNAEAAASWGRMLMQAEYRWTRLALPSGDDPVVSGGYLTARRVLSGEIIPYKRSEGVFGRVTPARPVQWGAGDWGAWELVSRVSTINLNPLFGLPDVPGPTRRLLSASVGLNWYLNANAKCQVEWVNGNLNDPLTGDSISNTFAGRAQFDF